MRYGFLLYEGALVLLIIAMAFMGAVFYRLAAIAGKKQVIWVFPLLSALVLLVALVSHMYANFVLLPQFSQAQAVVSPDATVTAVLESIKQNLFFLKAFSFTCFFFASLSLTAVAAIYMRWISK